MENQANYSTQESIYASFKIASAGNYKAQALETFIRCLANEKDKYKEADEFLKRHGDFSSLATYYTELGGEIVEPMPWDI
jgi:hypothetical protein